MHLGYCTTEYRASGLTLQGVTGAGTYQAAVYFTSDLLDKYEGDKITAVEFAINPKRGKNASVFVCDHINYIQSTLRGKGETTEYHEGWNTIKLDKPVTIAKGMDLYVGYQVMLDEGEAYDFVLFDKSPYAVQGNNL